MFCRDIIPSAYIFQGNMEILNAYVLISIIILLCAVIVFLYLKYRKKSEILDLSSVIVTAGIGGYYIKKGDVEEFSPGVFTIFDMRKEVNSFAKFSRLLGNEGKNLAGQLKKLTDGTEINFVLEFSANISGENKYFKAIGNRIEDDNGQLYSLVVWFYDLTPYNKNIRKVSDQIGELKRDLKQAKIVFDEIPVAVWIRDKSNKIIYCNEKYKSIVNKSENIQEIPELDESIKTHAINANGKEFNIKKHIIVNGERRFFDIKESFYKDEMIGYAVDITDIEDIEKELQRHMSAHDDLLQSSSSAIAIYGFDTKLEFYNQAFVSLWGLDEKWLNTKPTYSEFLEHVREKRLLPEQSDFKKFRSEQAKMFKDLISTHEEFYHLPDGRAFRVIVIPHALGGLLFAYEDMTDRFAMETSYNTLIAVQKETLDNLSEGVAVFGEDGRLKLYNPRYLKIWEDIADVIKKFPHISDLLEAAKNIYECDNWNNFKSELIEKSMSRTPSVMRVELRDGRVLDRITRPLPDGASLISYVDVTASIFAERSLKERNEALEEADRLKTEFLANVSYELRTPLTTIIGFSEILETETMGRLNDSQKDYIKGIYEASSHLLSLINDILDLASIEAGYMVLEPREFDICESVGNIVNLNKARARESGITIEFVCDKNIGDILGDERRIKQVTFNILSNAIKFNVDGGRVVVTLRKSKEGGWVELEIKDTGIGIPSKEVNRVFERFFKSTSSYAFNKSGTGLGLAVAKNIMDMHNGRITLESIEGRGTVVTCYFRKRNNVWPELKRKPILLPQE